MEKYRNSILPMLRARLAFCFVNLEHPRDIQEDVIFGSHRRQVTFFSDVLSDFSPTKKRRRLVVSDFFRKVAFWFPSFMLEPNRHNRATPNVTVFFTPTKIAGLRLTPRLSRVRMDGIGRELLCDGKFGQQNLEAGFVRSDLISLTLFK